MRTFEDVPAGRQATPLLIGLTGASSSGKTTSALRLATGIARVSHGPIFYIDTEARRSLHYAPRPGDKADPPRTFDFRFVEFKAPFGPLDYLAAIEHCAKQGAKTIVVDSMSHEHEGPGGVLELHEAEAQRLAAQWRTTIDKVKMSAWQKPKSERKRLLNSILQMPINFVFCFRAKEKMDLSGDKPKSQGWCPIGGEEFIYEMTINFLLYPGSDGVPTWSSKESGEKSTIKLPGQFRSIFAKPAPIDEDAGQKLAEWAAGGKTLMEAKWTPPPGQPAADVGLARPEQIDEIGHEIARLEWSAGDAAAWLQKTYGVRGRAQLTEAQAANAVVTLMEMTI